MVRVTAGPLQISAALQWLGSELGEAGLVTVLGHVLQETVMLVLQTVLSNLTDRSIGATRQHRGGHKLTT